MRVPYSVRGGVLGAMVFVGCSALCCGVLGVLGAMVFVGCSALRGGVLGVLGVLGAMVCVCV